MTFDLIIFDCDGTLVDTEYANNLATIELLHEQGLTQYDMEYALKHFVGTRFSEILQNISVETGHNFPDDIRQQYIDRARALLPRHIKKIEGAEALIKAAKESGKICVGSNGQRDNVIYSLELAGLLEYFPIEHIFTGLDVANPKPAPDLYLMAAEKLDAKPENTLVIEDSRGGATAGVAAGMTTYGFVGSHHEPDTHAKTLKEVGVDHVFTSLIHINQKLFGEKAL